MRLTRHVGGRTAQQYDRAAEMCIFERERRERFQLDVLTEAAWDAPLVHVTTKHAVATGHRQVDAGLKKTCGCRLEAVNRGEAIVGERHTLVHHARVELCLERRRINGVGGTSVDERHCV